MKTKIVASDGKVGEPSFLSLTFNLENQEIKVLGRFWEGFSRFWDLARFWQGFFSREGPGRFGKVWQGQWPP